MEQLTEQYEFPCENSWALNVADFSPYGAMRLRCWWSWGGCARLCLCRRSALGREM